MTISFSGLASGLDTSSWVESLVALKQAKVTELEDEKDLITTTREAVANIKSFFTSFRSVLEKVTDAKFNIGSMDIFAQNLATSSDVDILSAIATADAKEATYDIEVDNLATATQAISGYKYTTTIVSTTTATIDSKLGNLGVKAGNIGVDINGIQQNLYISENDTIKTFINKLSELGVSASFNNDTGVFNINIGIDDINDIDNTGIIQALHLEGVNEGYQSGKLQITDTETTYEAANEQTLMSDLGVKAGTVTIEANDAIYNVKIDNTTTIGKFIQDLLNKNINASIDENGVFKIEDAVITNDGTTDLIDTFGLTQDASKNTQQSGDLVYNTVVTQVTEATLDTLLTDISDEKLTNGATVIVKNSNNETSVITLNSTSTLGDLFDGFKAAGLNAAINDDGTVIISGGEITGGTYDVASAFGLVSNPLTGNVIGDSLKETITHKVVATEDTNLIADLGVKAGTVTVEANDTTYTIKVDDTTTLGSFIEDLQDNNITASLDENGVFKIENAVITNDGTTDLIDALGMTEDVSTNIQQSGDLTYDTVVTQVTEATLASLLKDLSDESITNGSTVVVKNSNNETSTITLNSTSTLGDLFDGFKAAGMNASLSDNGTVTISGGAIVGGSYDVTAAFGLTSGILSGNVIGDSLQETITHKVVATEDTNLVADLGVKAGTVTVEANDTTYTIKIDNTTTLGTFIKDLQGKNITASLDDNGVFKIENAVITNDGTTDLIDALGMTEDVSTNIQQSGDLTYDTVVTQITEATLDSLLKNLSDESISNGSTVIVKNSNNETSTIKLTATSTLGDLFDGFKAAGMNAFLNDNGTVTISGGVIVGGSYDVTAAFGLTSGILSGNVIGDSLQETITNEMVATIDTRLVEDFGVKAGYFKVTNSNGDVYYEKIYSGMTIGDLINDYRSMGITANLDTSTGVLTVYGGTFDELTDTEVQNLVSQGKISESNQSLRKGTDLLTKLYGSDLSDNMSADSAYSKSDALKYQISETVKASGTSTLGSLGLSGSNKAVVFSVYNAGTVTVTVSSTTTIDSFVSALKNKGVQASFDSATSRLMITDATLTSSSSSNANKEINDIFGFTSELTGAYASSNPVYGMQTIIEAVTTGTTLEDLGIKSKQILTLTVDGTVSTKTFNTTDTLGTVISWVNSTTDATAKLENGVFSVSGGIIRNSTFENALGLSDSSSSVTGVALIAPTTKLIAATESSTLGDIVKALGNESDVVTAGYTLSSASFSLTFQEDTTVSSFISTLKGKGITASFASGKLSITGDIELSGSLVDALGLKAKYKTISSSTSYANLTDKVSEWISPDNYQITFKSSRTGDTLSATTLSSDTTFADLVSIFSAEGIDVTLDQGQLTFDNLTGVYAEGAVMEALGVQTLSKAATIAEKVTSTTIMYRTVVATKSTTLSDLGITKVDNSSLEIRYTPNVASYLPLATKGITTSSTLGDLFDVLEEYGFEGSISGGKIIIKNTEYNNAYLEGSLFNSLNFSAYTKQVVSNPMGMYSNSVVREILKPGATLPSTPSRPSYSPASASFSSGNQSANTTINTNPTIPGIGGGGTTLPGGGTVTIVPPVNTIPGGGTTSGGGTVVMGPTATASSTVADLGLDSITVNIQSTGIISAFSKITLAADDTLGDLAEKLANYDISFTIKDGIIEMWELGSHRLVGFDKAAGEALHLVAIGSAMPKTIYSTSTSASATLVRKYTEDDVIIESASASTMGFVLENSITGERVTINQDSGDTLGDIIDKLNEYGFDASYSNGYLTINNDSDYYIAEVAEKLANILKIPTSGLSTTGEISYMSQPTKTLSKTNSGYEEISGYESSSLVTYADGPITRNTKLSELGINNSIISVPEGQNLSRDLNITSDFTIGEFLDLLTSNGFTTSLDSNGVISISSNSGSVLNTVSGNLLDKLGLTDWNIGSQTGTAIMQTIFSTTTVSMSTALSELVDSSGKNLGITSGQIYVYTNGKSTPDLIEINSNDTLQSLASTLAAYGISLTIGSGGKLNLSGNTGSYLSTSGLSSSAASNILTKIGATSWNYRYDMSSVSMTEEGASQVAITADTKLLDLRNSSGNSLGITAGSFYIYENGVRISETITADTTVGDFLSMLNSHGITASLGADGSISLSGKNNSYIDSQSGGSNIVDKLFPDWKYVNTYVSDSIRYKDEVVQNITSDTRLADINGITYQAGFITVNNNGVKTNVSLSADETIGSLINKLNSYGFSASLDPNGSLNIRANGNLTLENYTGSGPASNALSALGIAPSEWVFSNIYDSVDLDKVETSTVKTAVTRDTKLSELGVTSGEYYIYNNGVRYTAMVSSDDTVETFMQTLQQFGIQASLNIEGGKSTLTIVGNGNSYVAKSNSVSSASNIVDVLLPYLENNNKYTSEGLITEEETSEFITGDTRLADINGINYQAGFITINNNGVKTNVSLSAEETIDSFINKLNSYGFSASIDPNGSLNIRANGNLTLENYTGSGPASNALSALGIAPSEWVFSNIYDSVDLDKVETSTVKTAVTRDTKLSELGVTSGEYYIYNNGVRYTAMVSSDDTVETFMQTLQQFGIQASLNIEGGKSTLTIVGNGNSYVAKSNSVSSASNIVDVLLPYLENNNKYTSEGLITEEETSEFITGDTRLADINGITYQAGFITVNNNGVKTNVSLSADETIDSFINKLSAYGFKASLDQTGSLVIRAEGALTLENYTGSGTASNALEELGIDPSEWVISNTYDSEDLDIVEISTVEAAVTRDTKLSELGITAGEYYIYNNGVKYTAMISSDDTIDSFIQTLQQFGIQASLNIEDDKSTLSIIGNGNSYVARSNSVANASNIVDILFPGGMESTYNYSGSLTKTITTTTTELINRDTLLSDLDKPWGNSTLKSEGKLVFNVNDEVRSIEITSDETVGSLIDKLSGIGIAASVSNGVFTIQSGFDEISINTISSTSNLITNLELTFHDDLGGYAASSDTVMQTTTTYEERTLSISKYADDSTKLSMMNISSGSLTMYKNGQKATIQIDSEETFAEFRARVASALQGVDVKIEDGILKFTATDGADLQIGATTDTSNIAAVTGLIKNEDGSITSARELYKVNGTSRIMDSGLFRLGDVTEGTFTIGDAVFTIDSNTTINSLISQINSSEDSNANAYWDSIDGELVLTSRATGSSLINIEAGTSNFTDIMGYTVTETAADGSTVKRLMVNNQTLGANASFTINGTRHTSASNTVSSDISRIEGVTINLKKITEEGPVTLTIEKDKEAVADAIQEVVDAYNELMTNVNDAISIEGDLHGETTLKLIRTQLRSLMTSSLSGNGTYRNLDAIGITSEAASGTNISTENVDMLYFDREKFIEAYGEHPEELKSFLVGTEENPGVLSKVEELIESTLASVTGYFDSTDSSFASQIQRIDEKISRQTRAVERYRTRLEAKFQSMDLLIANMQNQYSSFLSF